MNREEILDKVKHCTPQLGWDSVYPDLYGKYGMTIGGICDCWRWFTEDNITDHARARGRLPLTDASDTELLMMWAIADSYWLHEYERWYEKSKKKSSKLDHFIGYCERMYFGYDEDGYTDKTIDRVLNSVLKVLEEKYKEV